MPLGIWKSYGSEGLEMRKPFLPLHMSYQLIVLFVYTARELTSQLNTQVYSQAL